MTINLADCLKEQVQKNAGKEALVYKDRRISYGDFDAEVDRLAALLLDAGLQKTDRVAVYLEKSPEEATALLAANRAGGIFIDVNHLQKAPQILHILRDSGTRFLFTTRQRLRVVEPIIKECPQLETLILHGPGENPTMANVTVLDRGEWNSAMSRTHPHRILETDVGAIIYTSGSTGNPKGVVLSQRNLLAGAESVATYLENTPEDRILSVMPFSFDYGLNQLTTSIYRGTTCVLINYLLPNDILKAMENENITGVGLIPPLWLQLLQKEWDWQRFPHWRYLTNTGGAMPETAVHELRRRLPNTKIYLMFGLTEAFRATYLPPEQVEKRPTSIGKAIPNAEIWVLNERGEHCQPHEEGELIQRGAHVALGYWNDPEGTRERFRPNPFSAPGLQTEEMVVYSGDRVKTDEEGYIYFISREDEMIKSSGYRVSPTEIEQILYGSGNVKHAAAFGIPDQILGQVIAAVVSPKDGIPVDKKALTKYCSQNLPNYLVPREIEVWDNLPLNPNGKIDRKAIMADFLYKNVTQSKS